MHEILKYLENELAFMNKNNIPKNSKENGVTLTGNQIKTIVDKLYNYMWLWHNCKIIYYPPGGFGIGLSVGVLL